VEKMNNKKWIYSKPDKYIVQEICKTFKVSPLTATVILNRGVQEPEDIKMFLESDINSLHDPFLMKGMRKAVDRIKKAIAENEKITVYGDYDVDGVTSTAILAKYLSQCGACVDYYIPDRIDEGYGINKHALEKIQKNGTSLVVTVDSGITALEEVEYAIQLGLDIIITDHHECKEEIPKATAVLNPKQKDCSYPFKELAGVGVAFKLIQALAGKDNFLSIVDHYCDIVCLGTIADVVPLLGENRLIVSRGLKTIAATKNVGLKSLINVSGVKDNKISTGTIGFIIAPRINAAGRVGSALRAVQLFLTDDEFIADEIAQELNEENKNRQATEARILQEALEIIEQEFDLGRQKVIVLSGEDWHHGVIGIVASRITDRFYRPSILIALEGDEGKGSGRSISGFNLFKALHECKDYLIKFGGHELAAGLSIEREKIPSFLENINNYANEILSDDDLVPRIYIDCEIDTDDLTFDTVNQLEILEPFGMGNAGPVFSFCNGVIVDIRTVGDNKHLKLVIEKNGNFVDAIGFNMANYSEQFIVGDVVDIACSLDINLYNGLKRVQLILKDIKLPDNKIIEYKYYKSFDSYIRSDIIGNAQSDKNGMDVVNNLNLFKGNIADIAIHLNNNNSCLIIVNTLPGIQEVIKELKAIGLDDVYFNVHFNVINKKNLLDIIINPLTDQCNFDNYDYVYIYDPCFNFKTFREICQMHNNVTTLFGDCGFEWCETVLDSIIPERQDFVIVYQYIKTRSINNTYSDSLHLLSRRICISYNASMNYLKLMHCINIFEELGLLKYTLCGHQITILQCNYKGEKVNIESSSKLIELRKMRDKFREYKIFFNNNLKYI
jgi:single-stranded-DNA-specific exonuclease